MDYYHCPLEELHQEASRRGYSIGSRDRLSDVLKQDDEIRGSGASTLRTVNIGPFLPLDRELMHRKSQFGKAAFANALVNEKIIFWNLNTFFPSLQLFFASGLSCTIESPSADAPVFLDAKLRFRLTDCTHEEDGVQVKGTIAEKFAHKCTGIVIREAVIALRKSVAVKPIVAEVKLKTRDIKSDNHGFGFTSPSGRLLTPTPPSSSLSSSEALPPSSHSSHSSHSLHLVPPPKTITYETHTVVGLRLEGMSRMSYVYARIENPQHTVQSVQVPQFPQTPQQTAAQAPQDQQEHQQTPNSTWKDIRIVGLRNDIPPPLFLGHLADKAKPGGQTSVVQKHSAISRNTLHDDIEDFLLHGRFGGADGEWEGQQGVCLGFDGGWGREWEG